MNYPEKTLARQFYNNLNDAFGQGGGFLSKFFRRKNADVFISVEGGGVHWSCKVEKDNRKCSTACFHYDFPHKKGLEYYIEFINDKIALATGRTSDRKFALNAIKDWIDGKTLPELHNTYEFVDQFKRKLEYINSTLLSSDTAFKSSSQHLNNPGVTPLTIL